MFHVQFIYFYLSCFASVEENENSAASEDTDEEEEDMYGNTYRGCVQSEPVPVGRLQWYNNSNIEAIRNQYEVCSGQPVTFC